MGCALQGGAFADTSRVCAHVTPPLASGPVLQGASDTCFQSQNKGEEVPLPVSERTL